MAHDEVVKVPTVVLGARLRGKRKTLRLSQHQLGGEEFSPSYVSAVERGKIRPSLKALYILADRLGEPVTYFLQDEGVVRSAEAVSEAIVAASIDVYQGRPAEALRRLADLPLASVPADAQARARFCRGQAYLANRQPSEAAAEFQEALILAEAGGDAHLAATTRLYLGIAYHNQHRVGLALDLHRRCLLSVTDGTVKDLAFRLLVYSSLGEDLLALDQEADALAYFEQAMQVAADTSTLQSVAAAQWALSAACKAADDPFGAREYAQKSLTTYETAQMLSSAASIYSTFGEALQRSGRSGEAEQALEKARSMAECLADGAVAAVTTIRLGELYAQRGDHSKAEETLTHGVEEASRHHPLLEAQGLLSLAQLHVARNERAEAEQYFLAALQKLEGAKANNLLSQAYFKYGQALVAWGETAKGSDYLKKAYLQSRKA